MGDTNIEWCTKVWNCLRGCSRVSEGCRACYAERQAIRHAGPGGHYEGLVRSHVKPDGRREPRWTGEVRFVPEKLAEPLSWRGPERVFVNSMSDLFHEAVAFETIAAIFGVMAACPRHTFQVLTKRPERARDFFTWAKRHGDGYDLCRIEPSELLTCAHEACSGDAWGDVEPPEALDVMPDVEVFGTAWPLPNVWLGVSVEDQRTADERIPVLLELPAAVRWVSYEPALGPINFRIVGHGELAQDVLRYGAPVENGWIRGLDWIVVGGESGPGARPFDLAWPRSVIDQGRAAGVPVFVKQLGAMPCDGAEGEPTGNFRTNPETGRRQFEMIVTRLPLRDRKGGDPAEWPEDLRVREWPGARSPDAVDAEEL
jgi:protein gp37